MNIAVIIRKEIEFPRAHMSVPLINRALDFNLFRQQSSAYKKL